MQFTYTKCNQISICIYSEVRNGVYGIFVIKACLKDFSMFAFNTLIIIKVDSS